MSENLKIIVEKRDGTIIPYDLERIKKAIYKASKSCGIENENLIQLVTNEVHKEIIKLNKDKININKIQEIVEEKLMVTDPKIARAYIEYRHDRDLIREKNSILTKDILNLIDQNKELVNENANKDSRIIPTQRDLLAGIVAKHYAKQFILPKDVVESHEKGEIHYHDLDYSPFFPMTNCCLVDLKFMLESGFRMGNADISTPKSITTATAITSQIIASVASCQYGGTSINRIDEVLAPYVEKSYQKLLKIAEEYQIPNVKKFADERIEKEVYDAFQALEYEVNTLQTTNGQTPFITFGFGLGESWQSKLIQKAILKNRINGLGESKKTAIFPKLVFSIKEGLNKNPNDPNYDVKELALKCASLRMYPDILNYEKVIEVTGNFKAPMGCRSFLSKWIDENNNEIVDGRNNLGVITINLPRIAIEAKGNENKFYEILEERLLIAKKALLTRIDSLKNATASVAPILYCEGAFGVKMKPDEPILNLFKNGRASISLGYIGIYETIYALYEEDLYDYDVLQEKALNIVKKLHDACEEWKKETGYGFSLYSTPAENLCYRFCKLDRKEFGIIKNVTDKEYYTNSFHLDVRKKVSPFEKILFEKDYPQYANGGFINYVEYGQMKNNLKGLESVWDFSYDKVPYLGSNIAIDFCDKCGFQGEFLATSKGFECPKCGNHDPNTISVVRRTCGYLGDGSRNPFNHGKMEEIKKRVKHF